MTNQITTDLIESTDYYKKLLPFQKSLLIKRNNREILEQAFIHYKSSGTILQNIGSNNVIILTEIIKTYESKQQQQD